MEIKREDIIPLIQSIEELKSKSYTTLKKKYIKVEGWYIDKKHWVTMLENMVEEFNLIPSK